MDTLTEEEWDYIFKDFQLYRNFDENVRKDSYISNICKSLKNQNKVIDEEFCSKIEKNLKYVYSIKEQHKSKNICLHYKYWLYDKMWKNIKNISDANHVKNVITDFLEVHVNISMGNDNNSCGFYFHNRVIQELEKRLEKKFLHDYFKNYQNIKRNLSSKEKYNVYYKYLTYIRKLFDKYKEDCSDFFDFYENLCDEYFEIESEHYNPSNLLAILQNPTDSDLDTKQEMLHAPEQPHLKGSFHSFMENDSTYPNYARSNVMSRSVPSPGLSYEGQGYRQNAGNIETSSPMSTLRDKTTSSTVFEVKHSQKTLEILKRAFGNLPGLGGSLPKEEEKQANTRGVVYTPGGSVKSGTDISMATHSEGLVEGNRKKSDKVEKPCQDLTSADKSTCKNELEETGTVKQMQQQVSDILSTPASVNMTHRDSSVDVEDKHNVLASNRRTFLILTSIIFAIIYISFRYYKITPFGKLLRNEIRRRKRRKKKRYYNYHSTDEHSPIEYMGESVFINSQNRRFNINYQII
ncbi:PIR protein [Plasmodium ovale]|uniref:PIR Superfamily Protein n=2 Tax=Plasmodium ovale TaxID=36330 RepID=A0A1A8XAF8_PLAOA|nr:PIR Superfamily Protein [Plasmodium ovale curtisi]SBT00800.1 PIR Superfamily Protein [Plasmodium ovale curtisi]SBT84144.1 PIR protein [Plasmodium ovale]